MADLEAVVPQGEGRENLTVLVGVGTVLAGLVLLTLGGARFGTELLIGMGLPRTGATKIAFATAGTIPPLVLAVMVAVVASTENTRLLGLGGVVLALVGIAVGLPFGFAPVAPLVVGLYAVGLFASLSALVNGLLGVESRTSTPSVERSWDSAGTVDMFRSPNTNRLPADGGDDRDDLSFPLDEEE
ncbi:MAG: hypothetical protein ACOCY7_03680 [Halodesulfurarchaeum sp.]